MVATLRIVDESEYGPEPKDIIIPNGAIVTVRRHRQGADVTVVPGSEEVGSRENAARNLSATPAQFYSLTSCARDIGSAELMLLGRAGECVAFLLPNRELALLASGIGEHFGTPGTLKETELLTRVTVLERTVAQLSEPAGRPDLRDMGATLVDKARARWLEAKAARLEADTAAEYTAPADLGPLPAHSVTVDHETRRPGERILWVRFDDGSGRTAEIALPFGLALLLTSAIGNSLAERLPSPGRD